MKIILAPDSFKGTFTSCELINMLEEAAHRVFGEIETVAVPIADGGEGTVEALVTAVNGIKRTAEVIGPMGNRVQATYGIINEGRTAVIEMAQASGLTLVSEGERDPLKASSFGTGELIRIVLDAGIKEIIVGVGGSATNDGGMGAMQALGIRFLDKSGSELIGNGESLSKIDDIDFSSIHPEIVNSKFKLICDVSNPLLGVNGATYIYGPQKGVTKDLLETLDKGMENYSFVIKKCLNKDIALVPGSGAGGGMGAALIAFFSAEIQPGIDVILDAVGFENIIDGASLVITGEGYIDQQSIRFGKVISGIIKRCVPREIPVVIISGGMGEDVEIIWKDNLVSVMTAINGVMSLENALTNSYDLLQNAIERMFLMIKIGIKLKE